MKRFFLLSMVVLFVAFYSRVVAQYAPPAGQSGTEAIHADSSIFIAWGKTVIIDRGWVQIDQPDLGFASYGEDDNALGKADWLAVSLGDGGSATYQFDQPLRDGVGPDFAVFENSFSDDFLELAHVEVSSDGIYFAHFPSVSLTPVDVQVGTFGATDARHIDQLAGKYRGFYGTPFDLSLITDEKVNTQRIIAVRVVDVVGSIQPDFASYDSFGNPINDPWPSPFPSSGFDLDAIGVIHDAGSSGTFENEGNGVIVFPNPVRDILQIQLLTNEISRSSARILNQEGVVVLEKHLESTLSSFDLSHLSSGIYYLQILGKQGVMHYKMIKL